MSKEQTDLLPCPFCGGTNTRLTQSVAVGMSWVACVDCGLEAPSETGTSDAYAVAYWNRRASPSPAGGVQGVKVKPLEWDGVNSAALQWRAEAVTGNYRAFQRGTVYKLERREGDYLVDVGVFPSSTEAFTAAQCDYEQRILSALSSQAQTTGGVRDAVIDECRKAVRNAVLRMSPSDRVSGDLCDDAIALALRALKSGAPDAE